MISRQQRLLAAVREAAYNWGKIEMGWPLSEPRIMANGDGSFDVAVSGDGGTETFTVTVSSDGGSF